jgi:hypothetical protein
MGERNLDFVAARPFPQWRFLQLTAFMFLWMLLGPHLQDRWIPHLLVHAMLLNLMLVTIWANPGWRRIRLAIIGLWVISFTSSPLSYLNLPPQWANATQTLELFALVPVMAACATGVVSYFLRSERLGLDSIFATVVVYLLVGFIFTEMYLIVLNWNPDAFKLAVPSGELSRVQLRTNILYFSLVTLVTLGYGDILPNSDVTKMLAVIEAVVGQFYVAVVVAVLVGKYANQVAARRNDG